jgi:hypothetical protein
MPNRMMGIHLKCTKPACEGKQLTAAGLYKTVRRVLDVDGYYLIGTEYLECSRCTQKVPGWSLVILNQLDASTRSMFPAICTYRYIVFTSSMICMQF